MQTHARVKDEHTHQQTNNTSVIAFKIVITSSKCCSNDGDCYETTFIFDSLPKG